VNPAPLLGLAVVGVGMVLCGVRIVRGPTAFDRLAAFDCLVLDAIGGVLLMSMRLETAEYLDAVLIVTLLGFLGTVSLATYLEGTLVD